MKGVVVGDVIAGKYRVDRILGQGGMGVVVAATHLQLDERVALKFMLDDTALEQGSAARFMREARATIKLKGEHVARVLDVGALETGAPYIVMEFLEGRDLASVIEGGPISTRVAADYVLQACDGVAEAHARGIVHRDLKPGNLFLTRGSDGAELVKVLDFGISKWGGPGDVGLAMTTSRAMLGSPLYMSPEQIQSSRDVDARADIWSLGVILYEAVTGRVPFRADTLGGLLGLVLAHPPPKMTDVRADVPEAFDRMVRRCLEKDRALRWGSVAELAEALAPFGSPGARPLAAHVADVLRHADGGALAATALAETPPSTEPATAPALAPTEAELRDSPLAASIAAPDTHPTTKRRSRRLLYALLAAIAIALVYGAPLLKYAVAGRLPWRNRAAPVREAEAVAPILDIAAHKARIYGLAVLEARNMVITTSMDDTIRGWDLDSGEQRVVLAPTFGWGTAVATTRRGLLAVAGTRRVEVWNAAEGEPEHVATVPTDGSQITDIAMSDDGKYLLTGTLGGFVTLFKLPEGTRIWHKNGRPWSALSVTMSPTASVVLAAGKPGRVFIWSPGNDTELRSIDAHDVPISRIRLAPDGQTLATAADDGTVKLFHQDTGELERTLPVTSTEVHAVGFSRSGRLLAAGDMDGIVSVYDTIDGKLLRRIECSHVHVEALAFAGEDTLVVGDFEGHVRVYRPVVGSGR